ncbi:MAG: cupin domain-containing protein [Bacteroidales bacterium]|nr:cupin domain-containing protein [Candidatus Latescibacterota bacterium]
MKRLIAAAILLMYICIPIQSVAEDKIVNLLDGAPYVDNGMGKRKLVDEDHILMMQAALKPGQAVPQHNANSNVHIIILDGEVIINLSGKDIVAREGDLVPIAFKTPMNIKNKSETNATFLIIKTPNPAQMGE